MSRNDRSQRAGSQLNRTETVTVRLDPKLNYLCELAARSQRRTKSSLIEAALADALNIVPLDPRPIAEGTARASISSYAEHLWHVNDVERLVRLALHAPHLMTFEEQKIWATISQNGYFWFGRWEPYANGQAVFRPNVTPSHIMVFRVDEHWDRIKSVAAGDLAPAALPQAMYFFPWNEQVAQSTIAPPATKVPAPGEIG